MAEYPTSIGIMFPASWPTDIPDAHCTLLYLGDMADANFTKEDVQNVLKRLDFKAPGKVRTVGLEFFGPEKNILVTTLETEQLNHYRETLERVLAKINIHNASEYKDYNPHVTVDEEFDGLASDVAFPETIELGGPQLWWGNEIIDTF